MLLTVTPDVQAMLQKGELRIVGLLLATVWALATFLVVGLLPHFLLLAAFLPLNASARGANCPTTRLNLVGSNECRITTRGNAV